MSAPIFSIVTVVFNGVSTLEGTILSVLNQTFKNFEYIIIDGGSADGTIDIIRKYEERITVWVSEKDNGIYDAMNKAVSHAKGHWINFMNSGDKFYSHDVLSALADFENKTPVFYGDAMVQYDEFESRFPLRRIDELWRATPFCHQASFVSRDLLKQYPFDTHYQIAADYNLFFQLYRANIPFQYLPVTVCLFEGRTGTTNQHIKRAFREKFEIALKHDYSVGKSLYYKISMMYVHVNIFLKSLLGPSLTRRMIRLVKNR